jgi:hypothetical protein
VLSRVGNAALIGVSSDVPSTSHVPSAYREATTALELASVSQRVLQFSEIPLRKLLLHFAAQDFRRVLPVWANDFYKADDKAGGALIATLRAYANVDMNILKTAQLLSVHPNTVYARLQRIFEITQLQATSFHALSDLLAVSDCVRRGAVEAHHPNRSIAAAGSFGSEVTAAPGILVSSETPRVAWLPGPIADRQAVATVRSRDRIGNVVTHERIPAHKKRRRRIRQDADAEHWQHQESGRRHCRDNVCRDVQKAIRLPDRQIAAFRKAAQCA